jgi:hypothetical protein
VLLGEPVPPLPPLQASDIATEVMYQVAKMQSRYWTSIDVQACMPIDGERLAFSCFLFPISNAFLATLQKSLPTPTSTRSPTYQASLSTDSARNPLLTSLASYRYDQGSSRTSSLQQVQDDLLAVSIERSAIEIPRTGHEHVSLPLLSR